MKKLILLFGVFITATLIAQPVRPSNGKPARVRHQFEASHVDTVVTAADGSQTTNSIRLISSVTLTPAQAVILTGDVFDIMVKRGYIQASEVPTNVLITSMGITPRGYTVNVAGLEATKILK